MAIYSFLLAVGLGVSAPWWGWRMAWDGRYREGLGGRLGRVPRALREVVAGKRVVWVHAVSVGEVLAAARLVGELGERLNGREQPNDNLRPSASGDHGAPWVVVVSTTTATGQKLARERFGVGRVFYFPLDFGWVVGRYLRALRPELVVLVESELWPRLLHECERTKVPVAVVNARVSDRSFRRAMRVRRAWGWMGRKVTLWLAQGEESAGRLRELGVEAGRVRVAGNLKYDLGPVKQNRVADAILGLADGRHVVVAGSTTPGKPLWEEEIVMLGMQRAWGEAADVLLVLAPRHPERFREMLDLARDHGAELIRASQLLEGRLPPRGPKQTVLLDTIGDLANVYQLASVAVVGGSLVPNGGHNPLEAARFGVPVVMGESYENFREIVEGMRAAEAIWIVPQNADVGEAITDLLSDDGGMGEQGRRFFEGQAGATGRTVAALVELMGA